MGAAVFPGKKFKDLSGTVGSTAATLAAAGTVQGILFIQNTHATANMFVGLAGETPVVASRTGIWLAPGAGIILTDDDVPAANAIIVISDTSSTPYTAYTIG